MKTLIAPETEKSLLSTLIQPHLFQIIGYRLLSVLLKRADQKSAFSRQKMQEETASMVNPLVNHFIQIAKNKLVSFLIKLAGRKNAYLRRKQNIAIQDSILTFLEISTVAPKNKVINIQSP